MGCHLSINAFLSASVLKHSGGAGSLIGVGRSGGFSVSPVPGCLPSSGVGVGVGVISFGLLHSSRHSCSFFASSSIFAFAVFLSGRGGLGGSPFLAGFSFSLTSFSVSPNPARALALQALPAACWSPSCFARPSFLI